jgi:hypothetical protein
VESVAEAALPPILRTVLLRNALLRIHTPCSRYAVRPGGSLEGPPRAYRELAVEEGDELGFFGVQVVGEFVDQVVDLGE